VYDFQVSPDRSIEPPAEPLPARWGLDNIFSASAVMAMAPDDATRLKAFMTPPKGTYTTGQPTVFESYQQSLNQNQDVASVTTINPTSYDGTFVPSGSVRTVVPPNEADELANLGTDNDTTDKLWAPPWGAAKGV
jgi:hypothetical protein